MNAEEPIFILTHDKYNLYLIERYLQFNDVPNPVRVSRHAHEAAYYFQGAGIYADRAEFPEPGLLILDLQLPENASFHLLQWLRASAAFRELTIVGTGIWKYSAEIQEAFDAGINAYYRIPAEIHALTEYVQKFVAEPQFDSLPIGM